MSDQKRGLANYHKPTYLNQERWMSYWYQILAVALTDRSIKNCLEVGCGNKLVTAALTNLSLVVKTMDIDEELKPDYLQSITQTSLPDNSFDAVLCAEVLEHLPFEQFPIALKQLHRVTRKITVISLPHWGRHFSLSLRLPYFKKIDFQTKFHLFPKTHIYDGHHYWEIGKKGYSLKKIKKYFQNAGFTIANDFIAFESPYHHFFILKK